MKPFVHLHNHTEYSLLDGCARIEKLVNEAVKAGAPAVAITDHGNMFGAYKFYKACKQKGINPIIGCEFYVAEDIKIKDRANNKRYHLVLLAKDNIGYHNLMKLCSVAYVEGFYERPRIDLNLLKKYSEGLICLSGCIAGALSQILLEKTPDSYERALMYARSMQGMFKAGDYYVEIQNHGIPEELEVLPLLRKIAREIDAKTVATNDLHYVERSDAKAHDVLLCIQTASDYDDPSRMRFFNDEFYYKSYDEMQNLFGETESLDVTLEIANKCQLEIKKDRAIPKFVPPEGFSDDAEYLTYLTWKGIDTRYSEVTEEMRKRIENELTTIISMGFASYYLIVWDFINYAKKNNIAVGPGRGSGVGSIVAYAVRITDVDPLKYDLLFERFLNSSRVSMPDFDIDFCSDRREEVIEYVRNKYGTDHVAQIITFGTMKKKNAIKNVARVFKIPFAEANALVKNIMNNDKNVHIKDLLDPSGKNRVQELVDMYESSNVFKEILDLAKEIEDMPRDRGKHAAGVIICDTPIMERVPLAKNGEDITTQYDMGECEELGLLKMDFLALKTLTDIQKTIDYVEKYSGYRVDFEREGYDDPRVYQMIGNGETDTVFQLESSGMKGFMQQLKPTTLEDIIAGVALYRPGPIDNIKLFVSNKKNQDAIVYSNEKLIPILKTTYGIIVYQEQAMRITQALAGYSLNEADDFRKFISKKKMEDLPKHQKKFVDGCKANGLEEDYALEIWKDLETFGNYAFNKSHSAAYAVLSYQTAYLKHHYPVEYLCAVINNRINSPDDTAKYLKLIRDMGIEILFPDINHCEGLFIPEEGKIRYGLVCIKNVGRAAVDAIVKERERGGHFQDFSDFARRVSGEQMNKKMIESLIRGGAFDCFGYNRTTMLQNYEEIFSKETLNREMQESEQMYFSFISEKKYQYRILPETEKKRLQMEREVLGRYLTGHPLHGHEEEMAGFNFNTTMLLPVAKEIEDDEDVSSVEDEPLQYQVKNNTTVFCGGLLSNVTTRVSPKTGSSWGTAMLEDLHGSMEIVIYSRALNRYKSLLVDDSLVKIKGKITFSDEARPRFEVLDVYPWHLQENDIIPDGRVLCILLNNEVQFNSVHTLLKQYENGPSTVKIQVDKTVYPIPFTVRDIDEIKTKLVGMVGYYNVKIREPK